ncbi:DUF4238 domain-containing protein [Desulfomonile tiedjei]|uniref:DUF4238 domain-containing protein n=1 Tax=Desulfomonile tiedjei (strain ATCC 49306 / DSM 6799 / DCB-1) TaxID=706587 RepID=I4C948_DESTA|nr:DUF4238 domain-containing protein [Desulfomonile tiedjei]AFM26089.1 hypothetical protein Desti_3437 [Desulfomonile tiedjei DSM 6799]
MNESICRHKLINRAGDDQINNIEGLAEVWDEVVQRIIKRMIELIAPQIDGIHVNLREEVTFDVARLMDFIAEKVINLRMEQRSLSQLDEESERQYFLTEEGNTKIEHTACVLSQALQKKYCERWKPKTDALLRNEKNPKKTKLSIKKVEKNHFIPKSFIRRYWSRDGLVCRFTKGKDGSFKSKRIPFSQWGYARNLCSDRLEAYFGLIEGDAVRPIEMLLQVVPLNRPQKEALIGFIVIQQLRNPHLISQSRELMKPLVKSMVGERQSESREYMNSVYETLYENDEFYDLIARPIFNSKWVLIRSERPCFVLPDTCSVFGHHKGLPYSIVPLTPSDCFVALPLAEKGERIVPHYVEADEALAQNIGQALIISAQEQFLADESMTNQGVIEHEPSTLIHRIMSSMIEETADK